MSPQFRGNIPINGLYLPQSHIEISPKIGYTGRTYRLLTFGIKFAES
jgi:hypothetical protein